MPSYVRLTCRPGAPAIQKSRRLVRPRGDRGTAAANPFPPGENDPEAVRTACTAPCPSPHPNPSDSDQQPQPRPQLPLDSLECQTAEMTDSQDPTARVSTHQTPIALHHTRNPVLSEGLRRSKRTVPLKVNNVAKLSLGTSQPFASADWLRSAATVSSQGNSSAMQGPPPLSPDFGTPVVIARSPTKAIPCSLNRSDQHLRMPHCTFPLASAPRADETINVPLLSIFSELPVSGRTLAEDIQQGTSDLPSRTLRRHTNSANTRVSLSSEAQEEAPTLSEPTCLQDGCPSGVHVQSNADHSKSICGEGQLNRAAISRQKKCKVIVPKPQSLRAPARKRVASICAEGGSQRRGRTDKNAIVDAAVLDAMLQLTPGSATAAELILRHPSSGQLDSPAASSLQEVAEQGECADAVLDLREQVNGASSVGLVVRHPTSRQLDSPAASSLHELAEQSERKDAALDLHEQVNGASCEGPVNAEPEDAGMCEQQTETVVDLSSFHRNERSMHVAVLRSLGIRVVENTADHKCVLLTHIIATLVDVDIHQRV